MENQNELYHHGIKGQRWGIRRFQNKDGSLTKAGQRRAAKLEAEYEKVTGKKVSSSSSSSKSSGKKSIKDMTDDELREITNRLNAEKNYMEAQKNHISAQTQLSSLQPKKVNKGKELAKEVFNDVIKPAAKNVGKQYLEKMLKEATGIDSKDSIDALEKEVKKLELQKRKKDASDYLNGNKSEKDKLKDEVEISNLKKQKMDNEEYMNTFGEKQRSDDLRRASQNSTYAKNIYSNIQFFKNLMKESYEGATKDSEKYKKAAETVYNKAKNTNISLLLEDKKPNTTLLLEDKSMKHSGEIMEEGDKMNELYHHGVKGMKWGVRKTRNTRMKNEMYKTNKKISSDFKKSKGKSDSYEKTMTYVGNKSAQLYLRRKDRAKMHEDIMDPNKNRGLSIGKAFVKTYLKDMAISSIPASAVAIGVSTITANPFLGMYAGSLISQASSLGVAGTRIYNTAKNK